MSTTQALLKLCTPLPTPKEMAWVDQRAQELGIPGIVLMENASQAACAILQKRYNLAGKRIYLVVGAGNNGGDALCMARYLGELGAIITIFLTKQPAQYRDAAATELAIAQNLGLTIEPISALPAALTLTTPNDLIIDGLLGTGFQGPLRPDLMAVIDTINKSAAEVVALDIPSGLDGQTGIPSPIAIQATCTIVMASPKIGLVQALAKPYTGEICVAAIGIPKQVWHEAHLTGFELTQDILTLLPPLPLNSYKQRFGHTYIVGGGVLELTGAGHLAAYAALKTGAGLVTCIAPRSLSLQLRLNVPEIMLHPLDPGDTWPSTLTPNLTQALHKATSLVIGPGMGQTPAAHKFLHALLALSHRPPVILDADALQLLAQDPTLAHTLTPYDIITPHPGEAASLLACSSKTVQADRLNACQALAAKYPCVCVLKGAYTCISLQNAPILVSPLDLPALAIAGSGDVLAGILGALRGCSYFQDSSALCKDNSLLLAALGVTLHAQIGRLLQSSTPRGILARDLACAIPRVLQTALTTDYSAKS